MAMNKVGDSKLIDVLNKEGNAVVESCPACGQSVEKSITKTAFLKGDQSQEKCPKCGK